MRPVDKIITVVAVCMALFHLQTAYAGSLPVLKQVYIHLGFVFVLIFLARPVFCTESRLAWLRWPVDGGLALLTLACVGYIVFNFSDIAARGTGNPTDTTIYFGILFTLVLLEGTRRVIGLALPLISIVFILYAYFGPYMPGVLAHRAMSLERLASSFYVSTTGIAGTPAQVSSTYIALFVIFAGFLEASGAGKFFIDWSYAALAWFRGGPAKVAIIGSSLMGAINGSAVANTVSTGTFTIPVMKRAGLRPEFAAAVEASASSGGQLVPPVMGAAAFIMAELTNIPYATIMIAAAVPAILYYVSLFLMVDFTVAIQGIRGVPRSELPSAGRIFLKGWFLTIPLIVLVWMLVFQQYSPIKSAFYAIISVFFLSFFTPDHKMWPSRLMQALRSGGMGTLEVAAACGCAGIILAVMTLSGLALQLSGMLIDLSGGNLLVLLVLTMMISLVLGMGLPTSAVYIILAALVVPAMIKMGVPTLAAHLFVFYFGVLANVTPPVALAAYAGAAIAKANSTIAGVLAFRLTLSGFILPFIWVYDPSLILEGSYLETFQVFVLTLIALAALASAMTGYFLASGPLGIKEAFCLQGQFWSSTRVSSLI